VLLCHIVSERYDAWCEFEGFFFSMEDLLSSVRRLFCCCDRLEHGSSMDKFVIPNKGATPEVLRTWRKAALVLNVARRFRYVANLDNRRALDEERQVLITLILPSSFFPPPPPHTPLFLLPLVVVLSCSRKERHLIWYKSCYVCWSGICPVMCARSGVNWSF
jgi:hypothetical protein